MQWHAQSCKLRIGTLQPRPILDGSARPYAENLPFGRSIKSRQPADLDEYNSVAPTRGPRSRQGGV
jgi:hypothetical protein